MFFHTRFDMKQLSEMSIVNHVCVKLYGTKNTVTSATILVLLSSQELKAREHSKRVSTTYFSLIIFPEMFNLDPQKHDLRFNLMCWIVCVHLCVPARVYVCVCVCGCLFVYVTHYMCSFCFITLDNMSPAAVSKLKDVA